MMQGTINIKDTTLYTLMPQQF